MLDYVFCERKSRRVCSHKLLDFFTKVSETVGGLHYIGLAKNRYYAIHEINLDQILYVTQKKEKLDSTILFKDAKSNPTDKMSHMLGGKDPFAKMTPVSKRVVDDPFAGFTARSKKRDDDDNVSNKSSKSLYPMAADKVRHTNKLQCHLFTNFIL